MQVGACISANKWMSNTVDFGKVLGACITSKWVCNGLSVARSISRATTLSTYRLLVLGEGCVRACCLRRQLSIEELAIAELLYNFDWELTDGGVKTNELEMAEEMGLSRFFLVGRTSYTCIPLYVCRSNSYSSQ
jgi:hypothetical protein